MFELSADADTYCSFCVRLIYLLVKFKYEIKPLLLFPPYFIP